MYQIYHWNGSKVSVTSLRRYVAWVSSSVRSGRKVEGLQRNFILPGPWSHHDRLIVLIVRLVSLSSSKRHNGSYLKSSLSTQKSQKNKFDEETFGGKKVWGTLLPPTLICNASSCIQPKPFSLRHVKVDRKLKSLKPLKFGKLRKSLKSQNMSNRCMM